MQPASNLITPDMEPKIPPSFRSHRGWVLYDQHPLIVSSEADSLVASSPNYINHLPIVCSKRLDDLGSSPTQIERGFLRTGVFQLSNIPPEVRLKIYREYFIEISKDITNSHRQYPNLLAAVRGQPLLYRELLDIYHQFYNFGLGTRSEVDFYNNVSMELVRSIQHLTLEYADRHAPFFVGPQRQWQDIFAYSRNPSPALYNFAQFIKYVWYEPIVAKLHQARNLRTLVVSVQFRSEPSHPTVLDLLDLVFLYFPVLEKLTVYCLEEGSFIDGSSRWSIRVMGRRVRSLEALKKGLIKKKELTYMETYNEGPEDHITGKGLECHWVGTDGKEKCFVMETRAIEDAVQIWGEAEQKLRV